MWNDAEADCVSEGGHLVSIESLNENNVVYNLRGTGTSFGDDIWIGLNDKAVENSFVWSDGTVSSYRYWSDNKPDGDSDCTKMISSGKWDDYYCSVFFFRHRYVCETQSPSTQSPTTETQSPSTQSSTTVQTQSPSTQSPTTITVGMNFVNYFYRL